MERLMDREVIQRRGPTEKTLLEFYKTWDEYKLGFGNLNESFWIGKHRTISQHPSRIVIPTKGVNDLYWVLNPSFLNEEMTIVGSESPENV
ncbi:tnxb [Cordylochernes scorpioides]|uniref:Tnxb n=1 Tax=Cordylochernes scorpioides TaxID=51811 RepID=A0ABY6KJ22_9ARAC|nr:tnxb [Cordylochernes scorpioides]